MLMAMLILVYFTLNITLLSLGSFLQKLRGFENVKNVKNGSRMRDGCFHRIVSELYLKSSVVMSANNSWGR